MSRKLILGNKEKRFGRDSLGGASSATVVSSLLLLIVQGATTDDDMHNPLVLGLGRGRGTSHDGLENAMALLGFFLSALLNAKGHHNLYDQECG